MYMSIFIETLQYTEQLTAGIRKCTDEQKKAIQIHCKDR